MRHRSLLSSIVAATFALGLGSALASSANVSPDTVPASADREPTDRVPSPRDGASGADRRETPKKDAAPPPTGTPAAATSSDHDVNRPAKPEPDGSYGQPERTAKDMERIRLHCETAAVDAERPAVRCGWSTSESPHFAGYRLFRSDGDRGAVVFETRDRSTTAFVDHKVRPGATYHYVVGVFGPQGQPVGMSEPSTVRVPGGFEEIELACKPVSHEGQRGVACKWSEARSASARGYALARSVDGGPAERIFHKGLEGPNHHVDGRVQAGHRDTYVVLVLDGSGEVIGHSEPVTVGWPTDASPPVDIASR